MREPEQRVEDHLAATRIAEQLQDRDLIALSLAYLTASQRNTHRYAEALQAAELGISNLETAGPGHSSLPVPTLRSATGNAPWLPSQASTRGLLQYRLHARAAAAARLLRDYAKASVERDSATEAAARITDSYPAMYVNALWMRSQLARDLGDALKLVDLGESQRKYCDTHRSLPVRHADLKARYYNAEFFDDWAAARKIRLERVALRLTEIDQVESSQEPDPAQTLRLVREFHRRGLRTGLTALGNDGYELAKSLIDSGRALIDSAARVEARAWLNVAEDAWGENGLNGLVAVRYRRLELDAINGTAGDPLSVGRRMVECSRAWLRLEGQRRAALEAVRWGAPGDGVVLDRLLELRADAPPVDGAFLDLGIANWHLKTGDDRADREQDTAAVGSWREAARLAAAATAGLKVDRPIGPPVLLNPRYYIESLQVHAEALRRLREAGHSAGATEEDELAVRVASLPAVAQRLTASASPSQRATINQLYADWLTETAELAAVAGDHHAADVVMEVARRDLVSTVLYALTTQPDTPEQIAGLARRIIATLNIKITDTTETPEDGTQSSEEGRGPDAGTRGARVADQLTETLDVVGKVLGPVAKTLFDPRTVMDASSGVVLEALHPDGSPGAVLSLWLLPTPAEDQPRLLRRLTWRTTDQDEVHEHLDVVTVPSWLPGYDIGNDPARFFARLDTLTPHLLPPPLLDLLEAAVPDHPLSLTVIPTGLLVVPFAALPITPDHRLLDLAVIATAQSLRAITTLAQGRTMGDDLLEPLDIGIYDTKNLVHTKTEWEELHKYRPGVRPVSTLHEADAAFATQNHRGCVGVFALAIHGSPGPDGWSQVKQLPSGENLTTGHVLQWYLPRLVVGASCDTDIRTDAGGELGGATTIIGTLYRVDDEATAQIMGLFYAATAAGHPPGAALRHAQRTWITAHPTTRKPNLEHWAYLLTYGLPH